ncbi:DUF5777 family beta-barrel protein [Negadavirga shengliensis]|uniref:DUF5777 family beta-barrel protein n=1 Tax=Negadavirga shengliensis TaxID=1389218 RepID=A0ABV9SZ80_9BACT
MNIKNLSATLLFFVVVAESFSQDNLLEQLKEETVVETEKTASTFKGTRLVNGHSVETRKTGVLDFMISHRFGRINTGSYEFFGLDQANIRLGLEYALSDRLTLGAGRNSFNKRYDAFVKYRLLWQDSGNSGTPISLTWLSNTAINTTRRPDLPMNTQRRLGYAHQMLIARKFSPDLSLQLMPTYVHRNMVETPDEINAMIALGMGGRYKLSNRVSLNLEYYYRFQEGNLPSYNAMAIGLDIETGGHVFQLHLTNAREMTEVGFIPATSGDPFSGDIHFGFNISRTFHLKNQPNGKEW